MELIYSPKIIVKESQLHGRGVFTKEKIIKDEVFEQCHFVVMDIPIEQMGVLSDYVYAWPRGRKSNYIHIMSLGQGAVYNHSETPNANWITDEKQMCLTFFALRDIDEGEEICIDYKSTWSKNHKVQ